MLWLFPTAFFILLGAVPLILLLNSLRPRGPRVPVTALFLLEKVLRERPMGRRLGWLWHRNLPLILQLLAALAVITALAGPALLGVGAGARDWVVVMDQSASMKAAGASGVRFDAAREELLRRIDGLGGGDRMMIIGAAAEPVVVQPFTRDRARLRRTARDLSATDAEAPVKEAVLLAHTFLKRQGPHRVVVLTDGAFKGIEELPWAASYLELVQVEGGADNVGILGFQFRRVPGEADEYEAMVLVQNFTERPVHAPLVVTVADRVVSRTLLSLGPSAREVLIYGVPGPLRGRATALLAVDDDLQTDNRAYLSFPDERPTRVLYVGPGNPYLERLLRYFPHVTLARIDRIPEDRVTEQVAAYDVVMLDRVPAPPLERGNFILMRTVPEGLGLRVAGVAPRPVLASADSAHPLAAGVRLDGLVVRDALALAADGGGVSLAASEGGPLIHVVEKGDLKALVFAFDLTRSDLPFRVSFPLLVRNAFSWFRPASREFPASQVAAGLPFVADVGVDEEQLVFVSPSGETLPVRTRERTGTYSDTAEVGFYQFSGTRGDGEFAVNLFSEEESRIRPSYRAEPAEAAPAAAESAPGARFDLWPVLLVLGLALLLAECVLVCRMRRSLLPLWLRVPAAAVLVLALVNPRMLAEDPELDVVMAVDLSHSVGEEARARAADMLERAQEKLNPKVRLGLFSFARRPQWEFLPTDEIPVSELPPPPERDATDLAAAIQGALGELSEGRESRIVLISDANENRGSVERVLPMLRSHGVAVWPYPVSLAEGRNEVYLSEFSVPSVVDSGETFEIKAALTSAGASSASISLLRDGRVIRSTRRELAPGANWLSFTDSVDRRGTHTYELMVEADADVLAENNLLQGIVSVKGPSRILYLHDPDAARRFMAEALRVQGYEVEEKTPARANLTLPELSGFDLLVLDNVPAYQLSQVKMERIERFVRDLGGGLIVLGGTRSYGAGGYYRTPLEQTLPVEMRPPVRMELPHVALLFVVDKSGSMGGGPFGTTKLDLAKAATMASAELLNPSDEVGILAFDSNWEWVVPFRQAGGGESIAEDVARLTSDGGTDLLKAMVEGRRALAEKKAAIKHVLVLSDGLTEKADLVEQVTRMARDRITVSTVSIGGDADRRLMTQLAQGGRGRSYATVDPRTIPQIFTTETLLISRDLLVEKTVTPVALGGSGPMRGLTGQPLPQILGYVLTHVKPRAEVHLRAGEDPLLVSWRYGLGRVYAFTSDVSGRWGRHWVQWPAFSRWAAQMARLAVRNVSEHRLRTDFVREGEAMSAVVDLFSASGRPVNHLKLQGLLTRADETLQEETFRQVAPGRYQTRFATPSRGINLLTVQHPTGVLPGVPPLVPNLAMGAAASAVGSAAASPLAFTVPFIVPFSQEYREMNANQELLERLARETGGKVLQANTLAEDIEGLFTADPDAAGSVRGIWWALAAAGLGVFLLDLALRAFLHVRRAR
ncbi:MAG: VWA domain-containing protein [Deltaproteobacteria bacterium]|nr:VWA domain-containing protein [Deltaproteobacteria bacterium]